MHKLYKEGLFFSIEMTAAYTFYKFKHLIILVIVIAFLLAIFSQLPGKKDIALATGKSIAEVDNNSEMKKLIGVAEQIPDPQGDVENSVGNWFYNLIVKNPTDFIFICVLIAIVLFALGVRLATLRGYLRGFFK